MELNIIELKHSLEIKNEYMKIGALILVISIFLSQYCFSQNKDIEELTRLNKAWIDSYPLKDTAIVSGILADDFILISPLGTKMNKASVVDNVANQEPITVNIDSVNVRLVTPDVGLVTAWLSFKTHPSNIEIAAKNCYQDVYVKRKDRWFAVAAHVSLLNTK